MTQISAYDYLLPQELIAQKPQKPRDRARLLVLDRKSSELKHDLFLNLADYLSPGDLLVVNDTRVIPARLFCKLEGGGKGELLLLRPLDQNSLSWEALVRPGKKLVPGKTARIGNESIEVLDRTMYGGRIVSFSSFDWNWLEEKGQVPLPPYIKSPLAEKEDYQTIFAQKRGAVAAPTAGLHFTTNLLARLKAKGIKHAKITLHAGLGTFRPIRAERIEDHQMHEEEYEVTARTAELISRTKERGGKIVACGTTVVRALETAISKSGKIEASRGYTRLFITPGYSFRATDAIITNFHLPKSTLLLLVSAFASRQLIMHAYQTAIEEKYRFFSFGDAMLIL